MKTHIPEVHAQVIADAGFDPALVDRAIADDSTLTEVRDEHQDAVARYGAHGVPTLVLENDYAVYGPVVVPPPTGADAVALWDLVRSMARFPHLYELRHPKTHERPRERRRTLQDVPHDARLADGREPRAVTGRDTNLSAVGAGRSDGNHALQTLRADLRTPAVA